MRLSGSDGREEMRWGWGHDHSRYGLNFGASQPKLIWPESGCVWIIRDSEGAQLKGHKEMRTRDVALYTTDGACGFYTDR